MKLRHGFLPLTVIAARPACRATPDGALRPGGLRIRSAGPGDADAFIALSLEVIGFDQHFGSALLHPHACRAGGAAGG